jgi:hypothetical protein
MENIKNFENSEFCYPGGWSTFAPLKVACARKWQNVILYLSSCMKSSLFVACMIKFRQDFTDYKNSEKPMKTLHFSPLVLFLLHYEFIFTLMRVPWNFHGISMEFGLSSCLCWNAFSRIIPRTLWNGDATIYPAAESFYGIRVPA